jgi:HTH domain
MKLSIFEDLFLLQRVDHLIRTRATGSPKAFGKRLEVSECSIYRMIDKLRDMGLPIAYDKKTHTYYYEHPVKWNVEFIVGEEKLLKIQGGGKKVDSFSKLSILDRNAPHLCNAFPNHGAQ